MVDNASTSNHEKIPVAKNYGPSTPVITSKLPKDPESTKVLEKASEVLSSPSPLIVAPQGQIIPLRTLSMYRKEQKEKTARFKCYVHNDKFKEDLNEILRRDMMNEKNRRNERLTALRAERETVRSVAEQSLKALKVCIDSNDTARRVEAAKLVLINGE